MITQTLPQFGWTSNAPEQSHSYLLPATLNLLEQYGTNHLLDIGTGNGCTIPAWQSLAQKVAAMEPDDDGYHYAKQYRNADVRKIGLGDTIPTEWHHNFDTVVSLEVVEHLFNPDQLVKTSKEVLKKGGVIIVSTPYHGYLKNLALALADKWDHHHDSIRVGGHIKFWTRTTLSDLFVKAGFQEITFKGVGRLPYLWKSMIMVFRMN